MDLQARQQLEEGFRLQQQGELSRACELYDRVLARFPDNEFALNLKGVVCVRDGRAAEAIPLFERALRVNNRDPETHSNLGLAYKDTLDFEHAQRCFEASLALRPAQPTVLNSLGNVLGARGRNEDAIRSFEAALRLQPRYADCLDNLARALIDARRPGAAFATAEASLRLAPRSARAHAGMGKALVALRRYPEAIARLEAALALDGKLHDARIDLSTAQKQTGRVTEARASLEHVLREVPGHGEAHNCLGVLLEQLSEFDAAAAHFRQSIEHAPGLASAYFQLAKMKGQRLDATQRAQASTLLEDSTRPDILQAPLLFALGREYEKDGDLERALDLYVRGNRARAGVASYDPSVIERYVEAVRSVFPVALDADASTGSPGTTPVFVLGMPRSGTTLTEQILCSHSRIRGAGEQGFVSELVPRAIKLAGVPFPQCCARLSEAQRMELRACYLEALVGQVGAADFIVDKTPMNFQQVGLILTLLPHARILYCRRDPRDTCVSIFRLPFDENQSYSHDLAALGHYYRQHARLMDFWQEIYPGRLLVVDYEDTVRDAGAQAHRMLEFIGLPFEQQVLEFHRNPRIVLTPSAEQVRQPVYDSSVGAWRRYGEGLRPLLDALGEVASPDG